MDGMIDFDNFEEKRSRRKCVRSAPLSGWNLFFKALKKKGVVDVKVITSKWWSLTREQREALNERAASENAANDESIGQKQLCDDNIERFICQYCGCKFIRAVHIRQHLGECKIANPEKSMCKYCRKTFASAFSLNRHFKACQWKKKEMIKEFEDPPDITPTLYNDLNHHLIETIETLSDKAYMCLKCKGVRFEYLEISSHVENCIGKSDALNCALCAQDLSRFARIKHLMKDHSEFSLIENVENQESDTPSTELETILSSGNFFRDTSLDFDSLITMEEQANLDMSQASTHRYLDNIPNSGAGDSLPPFLTGNNTALSLKTVISMCKKSGCTGSQSNKNRITSSLLRVKAAQPDKAYNCDFCEFSPSPQRTFATFENLQQHRLETHTHFHKATSKQRQSSMETLSERKRNRQYSTQIGFGVNSMSRERDTIGGSDLEMEQLIVRDARAGFVEFLEDASTGDGVGESERNFVESGMQDVVTSLQSISCPVCQGVFGTGNLLNRHVQEVHSIELGEVL